MNNPTRVYIAAPWSRKRAAKKVARQLELHGYKVMSSWINLPDSGDTYEKDTAYMATEAARDLADIDESHVMLYLNLAKSEGKATELGYALADAMPVYVIGGKEGNVFLHLPCVMHIKSLEDFFARC